MKLKFIFSLLICLSAKAMYAQDFGKMQAEEKAKYVVVNKLSSLELSQDQAAKAMDIFILYYKKREVAPVMPAGKEDPLVVMRDRKLMQVFTSEQMNRFTDTIEKDIL